MKSEKSLEFIRMEVKEISSKILPYIPRFGHLGFSHRIIISSDAIKAAKEVIENCENNGKMKIYLWNNNLYI